MAVMGRLRDEASDEVDMIWTDKDTHSDKDFGSWQIEAPSTYVDPTLGLFAANTFIGVKRRPALRKRRETMDGVDRFYLLLDSTRWFT